MERALEEWGPYLDRLSDGETGLRSMSIAQTIEQFRVHPDVVQLKDGEPSSHDDTPRYALVHGRTLHAASIHLGYASAFRRSYPQFLVLRERYERPDLPFQVGIPNPMDLSIGVFGPRAFSDYALTKPFVEATVREIREIISESGVADIVFQHEAVLPLVALSRADADIRQSLATQLAGPTLAVTQAAPDGTRFGLHLCLGDCYHEPYATIVDVAPWVLMANAVFRGWPARRTLEYLHAPFAGAADPPPDDVNFYAPMAELELPEDVRFVAGFIHEDASSERNDEILGLIEVLLRREVDVAATCGLGRRTDPQQAWDAMARARPLVQAS
jgi:hypothetical protein